MQFKIAPSDIRWWFWLVTLAVIIAALAGWTAGYYLVISISLVHALFFIEESKSVADFETQVRITYFALTLFGLWPGVRFVIFLPLLAETLMIAFFDRSFIARGLMRMPWNQANEA